MICDEAFKLQTFDFTTSGFATLQPFQDQQRKELPNRRVAIFDALLKDMLEERPIRFLEIGVYHPSNIKYAIQKYKNIVEYSGVDDYGNSGNSPYVKAEGGAYWRDQGEAEKQYLASNAVFEGLGQTLYRMTSDEFYETHGKKRQWDVVFVDGNHKYQYALTDMKNYLSCVAEGGVMLVDDYDNPDTPEVTRAVTRFIADHFARIERVRGVRLCFVNAEKIIPTSLVILAIHKRG